MKSQFGSDSVVDDPRKQQKDAWTGNPKDTVKGDRYTYKESSAERRQRDRRRVLRQESWLSTYQEELAELRSQQARFEDVVNGFMLTTHQQLSYLLQSKVDEVTHWTSSSLILGKIDANVQQGIQSFSKLLRKVNELEKITKNTDVRTTSTEILASTLRRDLDDHTELLLERVHLLDCKFDLLRCRLDSRSREFRKDISDLKDTPCRFHREGRCTHGSDCKFFTCS